MKPTQKDRSNATFPPADELGRCHVSFVETAIGNYIRRGHPLRSPLRRRGMVLRLRVDSVPEDVTGFVPVIRFRR